MEDRHSKMQNTVDGHSRVVIAEAVDTADEQLSASQRAVFEPVGRSQPDCVVLHLIWATGSCPSMDSIISGIWKRCFAPNCLSGIVRSSPVYLG